MKERSIFWSNLDRFINESSSEEEEVGKEQRVPATDI
jgi:hypothetical protein